MSKRLRSKAKAKHLRVKALRNSGLYGRVGFNLRLGAF